MIAFIARVGRGARPATRGIPSILPQLGVLRAGRAEHSLSEKCAWRVHERSCATRATTPTTTTTPPQPGDEKFREAMRLLKTAVEGQPSGEMSHDPATVSAQIEKALQLLRETVKANPWHGPALGQLGLSTLFYNTAAAEQTNAVEYFGR